MVERRWAVVFVTFAVLAVTLEAHVLLRGWSVYAGLGRSHPFWVAATLRNVLQLSLVAVALAAFHRTGPRGVLRELRLGAGLPRALALGIASTSPMAIGLAVTRDLGAVSAPSVVYLAAFSPLVEEVLTRGFALGQLHRRAGWPLALAVVTTALLTGLTHAEQGQSAWERAAVFLVTGAGAALFSWLLVRWDSLWFPFAVHAFMNLWWELFSVARSAVGGWFPLALQASCAAAAVALTLRFARGREDGTTPGASGVGRGHPGASRV